MSLRIAYRRVPGLIAYGFFKIPSKCAVWPEARTEKLHAKDNAD